MQKIQESKIKMSRTVSGILNVYPEIVTKTPGLPEAHDQLDYLIEETERHSQGQRNTGTELTELKSQARRELETILRKICAAMAASATVSADPLFKSNRNKFLLTDSEITRQRDMQLFGLSYSIYSEAAPYAARLEPFATAEEVAKLKDFADNFNELIPRRQTQKSKSTLSTRNLEDAVLQIDLLLSDWIDVLVRPWEFNDPDFYKAYKNGRSIVNAASQKRKSASEENARTQQN